MRPRRDRRAEGWFWRYRLLVFLADLLLVLYPASAFLYALYGARGLWLSPLSVVLAFALGGGVRFLFSEKGGFTEYGRNFLSDSDPLFDCELRFLAGLLSILASAALAFPLAALLHLDSAVSPFFALILGVIGWLGGEHIGRTVTGCLNGEHLVTVFFVFCLSSALTPLVTGTKGIALLLMALSLVLSLVCYGSLLVQVGILRLATTRSTCHLTRPMLKSGTRQAVSLVLIIPSLAAILFLILSFFVTLLRLPLGIIAALRARTDSEILFRVTLVFPSENRAVNAGLALLGLLLLVLAIVLLRRLKDPKKRDRLLGVLFAPKEARKSAGAEKKTLEYRVAYTDVIRGAQGDAPMLPADYADLTKRLAACPSDRERIRLAYRMMVACLVSRNLGVSLSDTPREIAESLVSHGIGSDAAELSRAFETAVYAPPSERDDPALAHILERILSITRIYFV